MRIVIGCIKVVLFFFFRCALRIIRHVLVKNRSSLSCSRKNVIALLYKKSTQFKIALTCNAKMLNSYEHERLVPYHRGVARGVST
jgi:hypothetical protein